MGRRGYLCALERDELPLLENVLHGHYRVERRMMLDVRVIRDGYPAPVFSSVALNDAVVSMGGTARMVSLSLRADGHPLLSFSGDGVILSTPTGSTAYSMAAGGPILEPEAGALLITPICAHEIFARPLVLSPERTIRVDAPVRGEAYLSADGGEAFPLLPGDWVEVARSRQETRLMHVKPVGFYGQIYEKFR
jgi:NAD+ kinase